MKAVFFDMDGTLIDSRRDLAASVNHTRRDLGLPELSVEDVLKNVGLGAQYLLEHSITEPIPPTFDLKATFKRHYAEHATESVTLYPGVVETLAELHRRGWRMGLNTAKPAFAVKAILQKFGLEHYFGSAIIAGGDCPELKPSVLPLTMCAERMGHTVTPEDWMVGDNWTDIQCATNGKINGAFCEFGFGQLKDAVPTCSLKSFSELLDYLK